MQGEFSARIAELAHRLLHLRMLWLMVWPLAASVIGWTVIGYVVAPGLIAALEAWAASGSLPAWIPAAAITGVVGWVLVESGLQGPLATPLTLFPPMALMALGQGLALPNLNAAAVALHPDASGTASSLLGFGQQFSAAIAVQCMGLFTLSSPEPMMRAILAVVAASMLLLYSPRFRPAGIH